MAFKLFVQYKEDGLFLEIIMGMEKQNERVIYMPDPGTIRKGEFYCSSLRCQPPKKHCEKCSHASFKGTSPDKKYRWEFSPQFGVSFLRKDGQLLQKQPDEKNSAWAHFERWYKRKF